ncbi:hypothetical protein BJX70DRAFT_397985 [Aspergillus crustosus]
MKFTLSQSLLLTATLALTNTATAILIVNFTADLNPACPIDTTSYSGIRENDCLLLRDYPFQAYAAGILSGECEDPSKTPELRLFSEADCATGLVGTLALSAEIQCVQDAVTIPSVTVVCV